MSDPTAEEILDMSDEDFLKISIPEPIQEEKEENSSLKKEEENPNEEDSLEEEEDLSSEPEKEVNKDKTEEEDNKDVKKPEEEKEDVDYKDKYEKLKLDNDLLMAPFKANGVEITPKSIEDAKRLQQMGANYHKKMSGMKPALKALKTLENNELLTDGRLDFLIDLNNGNPDAIAKLLKEKQINPIDVDVDAESTYVPADHSASDKQVELDSVLKDLETSPSYNKTVNVVAEDWDESSRKELIANPQFISLINEQMDAGVYDQVMGAVTYERSMGKLGGLSDFDAYKAMGNKLEADGAFTDSSTPEKEEEQKPVPEIKLDVVKEQKRKEKKKAASPTKISSKTSKLPEGFNPLDMSDEEFAKFDPKLLGIKT